MSIAIIAGLSCRLCALLRKVQLLFFHIVQPPEVRDLKSWLKMYGEPSPDKIPTGFLTTFRASKKVMAAAAGNASAR